MTKKTVLAIALALAALIFAYPLFFGGREVSVIYKTVEIDRGDISAYVTATGTLAPTSTAVVRGAQGGAIKNLYAEVNSTVKKGDPLADVDSSPLRAKVAQAEADLKKARTNSEIAESVLKSNEVLYAKRLISREEYDDSKAKLSAAEAAIAQAKAELLASLDALSASTLRSPIDGVVISQNASIGQTAEYSFTVAGDLSTLRLDAHVSEADIGRVQEGQPARFGVDAYPNQIFEATVETIKNEPVKTNNVVTYDVGIRVDNGELKLKPGMTAEVRILVAERKQALRLPRAALRFIPPPSALIEGKFEESSAGTGVWAPSANTQIKRVSVLTGVSDDSFAELLEGNLREGDRVIIEAAQTGKNQSGSLGSIPLPQQKRF
ncbi:MAG: efflux RND transporter periplasmic adaptor subunit [Deltaproteobacteria bacterium]